MRFDKLEIVRAEGRSPPDPRVVREANALTSSALGAPVPLEETYEHFASANLRHSIYLSDRGERRLVAYSLNEISELQIGARRKITNYFTSAFLHPELRSRCFVYELLGSLRVTGREDCLLVRTQNPLVISSFARLAKANAYRLVTPLHRRVSPEVEELLRQKFGGAALVLRGVYGRCLTGTPIAPRTKLTRAIMSKMDPLRGDACLLVAVRVGMGRAKAVEPRDTEWR